MRSVLLTLAVILFVVALNIAAWVPEDPPTKLDGFISNIQDLIGLSDKDKEEIIMAKYQVMQS